MHDEIPGQFQIITRVVVLMIQRANRRETPMMISLTEES